MMHARKIVLHAPEKDESPEVPAPPPTSLPEAPVPSSSYARMDNDMKAILEDQKIPEFDKWILYQQVLERYLTKLKNHKISEKHRTFAAEILHDRTEGAPDVSASLDALKEYTVGASAIKARLLYGLLEKAACISWDGAGRVSIMGTSSGGTIKDYLDACMKRRINAKPHGWDLFVGALRSLKIPHTYVTNMQLQEALKTDDSPLNAQSLGSSSAASANLDKHVRFASGVRWSPY